MVFAACRSMTGMSTSFRSFRRAERKTGGVETIAPPIMSNKCWTYLFRRNARMRSLAVALLPMLFAAGSSGAQDLGARADSVMRAAERAGFSGVVRIARNGTTILEKGYGLANRAERIPFTPATVVQIGSNTKDFTVVAVLQLQERGRLNVKNPIGTYFPSAPPDKRGITIWQLVTHTAGLPDLLGGDFDPVSRSQIIENAMRARLLSAPGSGERYSNLGYSLLAAIIEQVTGQTYDAYMRDNIFIPLGLTRTGFLMPGFGPRDLAHGYLADGTDAGTMLAKPHAPDGRTGTCVATAGCCPPSETCTGSTRPCSKRTSCSSPRLARFASTRTSRSGSRVRTTSTTSSTSEIRRRGSR